MLARKMNFSTTASFATNPPEPLMLTSARTVLEAKPRGASVDRVELRKQIMRRYEKTLAYLAK